MSTMALVQRVQRDKIAISRAHREGRLPLERTRSLGHVPVSVVDYRVVDADMTDDEHDILRNTIEFWLARGGLEAATP